MRFMRLCAGVAVGGLVTLGAMGTAGATPNVNTGPALSIGHKILAPGGQVNVLPTPYTNTQPTVVGGGVTLQIGGAVPTQSDGNLGTFLAQPLPLTVCVICHPG